MTHKILVVDDEAPIREELVEYRAREGYDCVSAPGTGAALEALHDDPDLAIVLVDIRMPGRDGLELMSTAKAEIGRDLEFVILTGHGGAGEAIEALRLGAQDFLTKPVDLKHLGHVVQRTDRMLYLRESERLFKESLKAEVEAKTGEIKSLLQDLEDAYEESLDILAVAAEYKDPETGNHIRRIGVYAGLMASELGWPAERVKTIELAAPLHDVGKIGTPDAVLLKPGKLPRRGAEGGARTGAPPSGGTAHASGGGPGDRGPAGQARHTGAFPRRDRLSLGRGPKSHVGLR